METAAKGASANRWAHLELPDPLPDGVDPDKAAALLATVKGPPTPQTVAALGALADLGIFTEDELGFGDHRPRKRKTEPEAITRGYDRSNLELVGGASRPAPGNSDAEQHLINGFLRVADFRPKFLETASADHFRGASQRKVIRLAVELHDAGRPVEYVLMRDLLSRDGTAVDVGAAECLDDAMSRDVQGEDTLLELARNVRARFTEREEVSARRQLADMALDGGLRNGTFLAKVSEIVDGLSERASACEDSGSLVPQGWPEPAGDDALYGLAGKILGIVGPQTVADPMAILTQFLVTFGSIVGRGPCWYYEDTRHALNLFVAIVGPTGHGGKGTAWQVVDRIFEDLDPSWEHTTGLISGEGLIDELATGDPKLFVEEEFAAILAAASRKGNTLEAFIRKAWDGRDLGKKSSSGPVSATKYHLSAIFHITVKELMMVLPRVSRSNGHVNRVMWCCSRSRPGDHDGRRPINWDRNGVRRELREVLEWVRGHTSHDSDNGLVLTRDSEAKKLWAEYRPRLDAAGNGPLGPLRARAKPITMRLAGSYAVLDQSSLIRADHLRAAMAVWEYCSRSVAFVFRGWKDELPEELGRAFRRIVEAGAAGLTVRELARKAFHHKTEKAVAAIDDLIRDGLIRDEVVKTGGANKTIYKATEESL